MTMDQKTRVPIDWQWVETGFCLFVIFHLFPTDDAWCRDHGPTFVQRERNGEVEQAVIDWEYNAWGGKYPPFDQDNAIPRRVAETYGLARFAPGIVMEGGSIDVNGKGTLLTITEHGAFFDGLEPPPDRVAGTEWVLDRLGEVLTEDSDQGAKQ